MPIPDLRKFGTLKLVTLEIYTQPKLFLQVSPSHQPRPQRQRGYWCRIGEARGGSGATREWSWGMDVGGLAEVCSFGWLWMIVEMSL